MTNINCPFQQRIITLEYKVKLGGTINTCPICRKKYMSDDPPPPCLEDKDNKGLQNDDT